MKHHREENPNESVHRIDSNEVCFFFSSVHFQFTSTSTTNLLNEVMEAFTALYTNKESADSMTTSSVCSFSFWSMSWKTFVLLQLPSPPMTYSSYSSSISTDTDDSHSISSDNSHGHQRRSLLTVTGQPLPPPPDLSTLGRKLTTASMTSLYAHPIPSISKKNYSTKSKKKTKSTRKLSLKLFSLLFQNDFISSLNFFSFWRQESRSIEDRFILTLVTAQENLSLNVDDVNDRNRICQLMNQKRQKKAKPEEKKREDHRLVYRLRYFAFFFCICICIETR